MANANRPNVQNFFSTNLSNDPRFHTYLSRSLCKCSFRLQSGKKPSCPTSGQEETKRGTSKWELPGVKVAGVVQTNFHWSYEIYDREVKRLGFDKIGSVTILQFTLSLMHATLHAAEHEICEAVDSMHRIAHCFTET